MNRTKNLNLKLLEYNQAQKEVVINEAIATFDTLINKSVISFVDQPPKDKNEGDVYISSLDNKILFYLNGWRYITPREGSIFWVISKRGYFIFEENNWSSICTNNPVELFPSNQTVFINPEESKLFKINLNENISISFEGKFKKDYKIELFIIGLRDSIINWDANIHWIPNACVNVQNNTCYLIEIYCINGRFLCRNVAF